MDDEVYSGCASTTKLLVLGPGAEEHNVANKPCLPFIEKFTKMFSHKLIIRSGVLKRLAVARSFKI